MNYLIRDKNSSKTLAFFSNAPRDIMIWVSKKNQKRPDMIAKSDMAQINHVLDFVPYHIRRAGYEVKPLVSKYIHHKIEVESFMTTDAADNISILFAKDLVKGYVMEGYGIRVGEGKVLYNGYDWTPGMKTVKLIKFWTDNIGRLKVSLRYVKMNQKISLERL